MKGVKKMTNTNNITLPRITCTNTRMLVTGASLRSHSSISDKWNLNNSLSLEMEIPNEYLHKTKNINDLIDMILYGNIHYELIEKVIFNDPATVIIWADGTKTVVRCQDGEKYDPEKGLAMALVKKMCGNKGNYYKIFTKVLKKFGPEERE